MSELRRIKRALISVSDKRGLAEFAAELAKFGVEIISTGGTAKVLRENGLTVKDVSEVTGFPEMMGGRVKTLHPKIHGAVLALRDNPDHVDSMNEHAIEPIDMVVVNLYPFEETIAKDGVTLEEAVENIDIGGPAMIRSAAKNWRDVAVVSHPKLYDRIIDELNANEGSLTLNTRQRLAAFAFNRTMHYDSVIQSFLAQQLEDQGLEFFDLALPHDVEEYAETAELQIIEATGMPWEFVVQFNKITDLRYGENPHQEAALYSYGEIAGIAHARQLHGKEMSYNNYADADAAWNLVRDFDDIAVAIIKHTNPSGVGIGSTNDEAYRLALSTDPVSAFGGVVAFNHTVDGSVALTVTNVYTELIIAPNYSAEAIKILKTKKKLRVLAVSSESAVVGDIRTYKSISGGLLVQAEDRQKMALGDLKIVTEKQATPKEMKALLFAWTVCKHVKSNAIVFANENQTLGVGAGQMNRVDSVRIAAMRAKRFDLELEGSVLASDAFFPFRDNVDEAAKYGVSAIIQPGGSIKDEESIAAANEHGIAMAFTGIRHFKH